MWGTLLKCMTKKQSAWQDSYLEHAPRTQIVLRVLRQALELVAHALHSCLADWLLGRVQVLASCCKQSAQALQQPRAWPELCGYQCAQALARNAAAKTQ